MNAIETLSAVTDVCSDKTGTITLGKMVMKKAWIPFDSDSKTEDDKEGTNLEVDTASGQLYSVESGSDPYYPRGRIMAITSHDQNDVFNDDDDDDSRGSDDLVHKDNLLGPLRDMVLCSALCNSATIQRTSQKGEGEGKWEAHGDATEVALQVVGACAAKNCEKHLMLRSSSLTSSVMVVHI